jgi:hypothetical protein
VIARRSAALAVLVLAPAAGADEALVRAQQHAQTGVDRFKAQKYAEAMQSFEAAFALRPMPRLAVHLAETHLALGDPARALQQFQLFLRIARLADPERPAIEKRVEELAATAPPLVDPDLASDLPEPEPLPEDRVDGGARKRAAGPMAIGHSPPAETAMGRAIPIVAEVPRAADAVLVWLYYRNAGQAEFTRLALEPQGNAHVTAVPGKDVTSSAVQYYLEARDGGGRVSAASGSESSPHLVVVQGGAAYAPRKAATARMSKARRWFWGTLAAAGVLFAAGTVTALLAEDRENALERRADASRALGKEPGQRPSLFDDEEADIENEGQAFEAVSVLTFALGAASTATAGTLWFLDRRPPPRTNSRAAAGAPSPFAVEPAR